MTAKDAVGNKITAGDKCMHVRKWGNTPVLKEVTVMVVHSQGKIEIRTEGNSKNGSTYGSKLMKIIKEDESNK